MIADYKRIAFIPFALIFLVGANSAYEVAQLLTDSDGNAAGSADSFTQLRKRGFSYENLVFSDWNGNLKDDKKGDFMEFTNYKGLNIRVIKNSKPQNVSIKKDRSVSVNGKVVCDDFTKLSSKETYQKTGDGAWWRTNLQVGEPLTAEEIDAFDNKWTRYEDEQEAQEQKMEDRKENAIRDREEKRRRRAAREGGDSKKENAIREREERRRQRVAKETKRQREERASKRMQKLPNEN